MKIVNQSVIKDINCGQALRLDFGCACTAKNGFYGLNIIQMDGVDIVADLNEPLDGLPDNSVIEIYSRHTFEHISNLLGLMAELHRIVRPEGCIEIVVPHFSCPFGFSDPTHVRFFGLYSMHYFVDSKKQGLHKVPNYYANVKFAVKSVRIKFDRHGLYKYVGALIERIVNTNDRTRAFYERHLCWRWPASEVIYILSPDKQDGYLEKCHD
jgi:SAM-dependent methyltransferase